MQVAELAGVPGSVFGCRGAAAAMKKKLSGGSDGADSWAHCGGKIGAH